MYRKIFLLFAAALFLCTASYSQTQYKNIPLPVAISGVGEEYSGMCTYAGRVYLLPQYGDHKTLIKKANLKGEFLIYSLLADSIGRVVDGKDTALSAYKSLKVVNLDKLPDSIGDDYEGFEAISIVNNTVFLSIETDDKAQNCYLLKAKLDLANNQVVVDPEHIISLKRPEPIYNAGFEAVTWLPKEKKLLAYYEYNGMPNGGQGYLIDTSFTKPAGVVKTPQLYFRITDVTATGTDQLFGVNYFYNGDYKYYLDNDKLNHQESNIKKAIPSLKDSLDKDAAYLTRHTFARIVTLKSPQSTQWEEVATFDGYRNNWEGLTLYRKGALIVTDANNSKKQVAILAYLPFN
ncbi:hypothetical protein PQ469_26255 [Mucilaginibacter sp. KACC 22773]|uniref:hypothetical protein n=1 Tax=Mucilaginibacter sp. KACC 22773 TaxID=3025671 RepID=UPI002365294D|nr:hypothetical protein [Mucilaginibacter sp. KACC 22773]WDF77391.1 hypothetical protein PQ469_26255 [Mucilaginibacter sp. KACC 22773]